MEQDIEKTLQDFTQKIEIVRRQSIGIPQMIEIDLAVPIVDQKYDLSGNLFYIWDAPDESSYVTIRINNTNQPAIPYQVHTGAETPFSTLYITTPAGQAGVMHLIYATEAPEFLRLIDHRSTSVAGVGGILDELRGDVAPENWGTEITVGAAAVAILAANAARKSCSIQSKSVNAGLVYIGFDNSVTTTKWVAELQAGMSYAIDDYRGPLFAYASIAGQLVGYGEV